MTKCTRCKNRIEEGDWIFTRSAGECICADCLRGEADDLPIGELAKMLGYDREECAENEDEDDKKPDHPEQIPGQMDIWGGAARE